jgi:hypothetical protein
VVSPFSKDGCQHVVLQVLSLVHVPISLSTATKSEYFSIMNMVNTRLHKKMEDGFLTNYFVIYIETKITENFNTEMIIDNLYPLKHYQTSL